MAPPAAPPTGSTTTPAAAEPVGVQHAGRPLGQERGERRVVAALVEPVGIGRSEFVEPVQQSFGDPAALRMAGQRQPSEGGTVVAHRMGDEPRPLGLAPLPPVLQGQPQRGLHGLGPAVAQKDVRVARHLAEPVGQALRLVAVKRAAVREGDPLGLLPHGAQQLGIGVAQVRGHRPGRPRSRVAMPLGVVDEHPAAMADEGEILAEGKT